MAKRPSSKPESAGKADAPRTLDATCRIAVLHGADAFLRLLFTESLREALTKVHGEVDVVHYDGASPATSAADVLDECRSLGLMVKHKMVVVDDAEKLVKEENRPLFERYAAAPEEGTTLVLRAGTWRAGKLDALVLAIGTIVECEARTPDKAATWAAQRAVKRYESRIEPDAAALLVERLGTELGRIDSELAKLSLAAGSGKPITTALVREMVGVSREEEVWGIQQTLLGGDATAIIRQIDELLDISRQPATLITYACTELARKLHSAAAAKAQGMNPFEAAKVLKLWGPSKDAVLSVGARIGPERAARLLGACVELDVRSKTGLGSDPRRGLEGLAVKFARELSA